MDRQSIKKKKNGWHILFLHREGFHQSQNHRDAFATENTEENDLGNILTYVRVVRLERNKG